MESRIDKTVALFEGGYNCAQSVFAAYADLFGMEFQQALRISCPFGGGFAGMRMTCGAVSSMAMLAGLFNGSDTAGDRQGRERNFETVRTMADGFRAEFGSIVCAQLLGLEPGLPSGLRKSSCKDKVRFCAALVEKHLLPEK